MVGVKLVEAPEVAKGATAEESNEVEERTRLDEVADSVVAIEGPEVPAKAQIEKEEEARGKV